MFRNVDMKDNVNMLVVTGVKLENPDLNIHTLRPKRMGNISHTFENIFKKKKTISLKFSSALVQIITWTDVDQEWMYF